MSYAASKSTKELSNWVGRQETRYDRVNPSPVAALSATLDRPPCPLGDGTQLPPLWHWLYFLPLDRRSAIGVDGHAQRGGFLPPVPLPRRMWAGGRFTFEQPLRIGDEICRESTIANVTAKSGRSGELIFVLVRHRILCSTGVALIEDHDIVYRDLTPPTAFSRSVDAPTDPLWSKRIEPDEVLLFRYSALTFNGHRIHYDRSYVTEVERYPGLVVHGPLIATFLAELVREVRPSQRMAEFSFRAVSPIFDVAPFRICGKPSPQCANELLLWAETPSGGLAMHATARMHPSEGEVRGQ